MAWSEAAAPELCVLTTTMRNRRILDANMAAEGVQYRPVVEAASVDALYAHLAPFAASDHRVHRVAAATRRADWFRRPADGSARSPADDRTRRAGPGAPASIVAAALVEVAGDVDLGTHIDSALEAARLG